MKYFLPLLIIFLLSTSINAQYFRLDKGEITTEVCPFDNSITRHRFEYFDIYQTSDNTEAGTRIESCITLNIENGTVDLASIDQTKSLFIAYLFPEDIVLSQDSRYNIYDIRVGGNNISLTFGSDCEEGMCSGLSTTFLHSDQDLDEDYITSVDFPFTEANQCNIYLECGITEKTEINRLIKFIYRIHFEPTSEADELSFAESSLNGFDFDINVIPQNVTVSENYWNGDNYEVDPLQLFGFSVDHIIKHYETGVPSSDNISYTNLNPEVNSDTPKTLQLTIGEYGSLRYQMHTQLRGGLLEGSDEERHPLIIEDNFDDLCLFSVELIVEEEVEFRLGNGVNFNNSTACIQLRDGGKLTFTENAIHHYGNNGVGNLNLRTGANVILEKGAHLYFDGHLILSEYVDFVGEETRIQLDLTPGTALTMTKDVTINSKDGSKLYINMLGGQIDISLLPAKFRKHIELVYPENYSLADANSVTVFPNPAHDYLYFTSPKGTIVSNVNLLTTNGITIMDLKNPMLSHLDVSELPQGVYYMKIQSEDIIEFHKIYISK